MLNESNLKLLALLSRPILSEARISDVASMLNGIDFPSLQKEIFHHRIDGCSFCNIQEHFRNLVPQEFLAALKARYRKSAALSLQQFQMLNLINHNFRRSGIPVFILKGIPLAERLYGDIAKRYSKDIDLLIFPEDRRRAHELLISIGFEAEFIAVLSDEQQRLCLKKQKDITYRRGQISVELHIRLTPRASAIEPLAVRFLESSSVCELERYQVLEFVYLCWHANHSNFHRIKWLTDIVLILENNDSTEFYESVLQVAKEYGVEWDVLLCMELAKQLYALKVPQVSGSAIVETFRFRLLLRSAYRGMTDIDQYQLFRTTLYNLLYRFLKTTSWRERGQLLIWALRPSPVDVQVIGRYAGRSIALYYFLRPFTFIYRRISALTTKR